MVTTSSFLNEVITNKTLIFIIRGVGRARSRAAGVVGGRLRQERAWGRFPWEVVRRPRGAALALDCRAGVGQHCCMVEREGQNERYISRTCMAQRISRAEEQGQRSIEVSKTDRESTEGNTWIREAYGG